MVQETEPGGAWAKVDIAGHLVSVLEPDLPHPQGYVAIYLHAAGCEDLADDAVFTRFFTERGLRVVAPHGGQCWWGDRLYESFDREQSPEQFLISEVLPFIEAQWSMKPPGVALIGVSMGGQGALRLAYKHPDLFPVAAAISPAIDFHLWLENPREQTDLTLALRQIYRDAEDARQDTATLHIHPLNWPRHQFFCCDPADHWHESAERLQMKLGSLGIPHESDLITAAGGHSWGYFHAMAPRAIDFIVERMEQERLRIPPA